jgi:hypothetical protein
MSACEFSEAIRDGGRGGLHRLPREESLDVGRDRRSGLIAAVAVFFETLHRDAVEVSFDEFQKRFGTEPPVCGDSSKGAS